jgi:hypothetical protein
VAAIKRFEDILAWQKARILTNSIYKETSADEISRMIIGFHKAIGNKNNS